MPGVLGGGGEAEQFAEVQPAAMENSIDETYRRWIETGRAWRQGMLSKKETSFSQVVKKFTLSGLRGDGKVNGERQFDRRIGMDARA